MPVDLLSLLRASPGLAWVLTFQHTTLQDEGGRTILHLLAREGEGESMKLLLANDGIRPDPKDNWGRTPLLYAAWRGHEAVVRLLLDRQDVEADSMANRGQTPSSFAAGGGHEAVVRLLLADKMSRRTRRITVE
ncbi:hypothetical protein NUH16_003120 [Penicillium rubens]|nr:hypothetical protein NUH16_003120 [Penicillium rubens]